MKNNNKILFLITLLCVFINSQLCYANTFSGGFDELQNALNAPGDNVFYANETVTVNGNLNAIQDTTLSLYGNNKSISGGLYTGLSVDSSQALSIHDFGSYTNSNGTITINDSINNFKSASSFITNTGTLNISGTAFYNNQSTTSHGGALSNSGMSTITNCLFAQNSSYAGGIYNNGTLNITNSDFLNNYNTETYGEGGAIYNVGNLSISNSNFIENGISTSTTFIGSAIFNKTASNIISTINGSTFKGNAASWGGAIYNASGILNIANSNFSNNYTDIRGGAIYNVGTLHISSGTTFTGNGISSGTVKTVYGGAIHNGAPGCSSTIDETTFTGNAASQGGAIYNNSGTLTITNSDFSNNHASGAGAIYNSTDATMNISGGSFTGNYITGGWSYAGAINNNGILNIDSGTTFTGNGINSGTVVAYYGGAIYNNSAANLTINEADFTGNAALYRGGAIYNDSENLEILGANFTGNYTTINGAIYGGGAIFNAGDLTITNTSFTNNQAAAHGGAIHNTGTLKIMADSSNVNFTGNTDSTGSNAIYSTANIYLNAGRSLPTASQGAITFNDKIYAANQNLYLNTNAGDSTIKTGNINFNEVVNAANVYVNNGNVYFNTLPTLSGLYYISGGSLNFLTYVDLATYFNITGGTINYGSTDASTINMANKSLNITAGNVNFINSAFSGTSNLTLNNASSSLGFVNSSFNGSSYLSSNSPLTNTVGTLNASSTTFSNYTSATNGGAVYNGGSEPNLDYTILNLSDTEFTNNRATNNGGAVYNYIGKVNISDSEFNSNNAGSEGGAVYSYHYSATLNVSDSIFESNNANDYGGAIYVSSKMDYLSGSTFIRNTASRGGALFNSGIINLLSDSIFDNNTANNGGAIYNNYGVLTASGLTLKNNIANSNGGAIYDDSGSITILDSEFTNNIASGNGGAIYSNSTLAIFAGTGKSTYFSGNRDASGYNDIYMASGSTLNLNAGTSGTITFNDAVSAAGASIYINSSNVDSTLTKGIIDFESTVTAKNIYIYDGTTYFKSSATADNIYISGGKTYFYSSVLNAIIDITGGTVSFNSDISSSTINVIGGTISFSNHTYNNVNFDVTTGSIGFSDCNFTNNSTITVDGASAQSTITGLSLNGNTYTNSNSFLTVTNGHASVDSSSFVGYTSVTNGGAISNAGTLDITNGSSFSYNTASSLGGAILNTGTLSISDSSFSNNSAINGGAIYNEGNATIINTNFTNNIASSSGGLGGAIYNNGGTLNIIANGNNVLFSGNNANGDLNAIHLGTHLALNSTLNLNASSEKTVTFADKITSDSKSNTININKPGVIIGAPTAGTICFNNTVNNSTINLYNGTLSLSDDSYINNNNVGLYGGTLSLLNNKVGVMSLGALTLSGTSYLKIDADLSAGTADKITASSVSGTVGTDVLKISNVNLLNNSTTTKSISVAEGAIKNYIELGTTTAESALYKYNLSYDSLTGNMNFVNTHQFTPSILTSQVGTLIGTYLTQTNTYHEAFSNMDSLMFIPRMDRLLMQSQNKTASADDQMVFSPTFLPEDSKGLWFKQFTTFENVPLNNGPNVSNVGYGMLIGGDTDLKYLGHGYIGYLTLYTGYNGSHQNYDSVGAYQNGGLLGVTGTVYKGNFFAALTTNTSASNGNAYTTSGTDNFTTLVAGAAIKTGYNFEFLGGKFIIQPSYTMSYTFAKTFDYTTSSGANIKSDPLNAIQISPGIKFIGNLKNGWQPYVGVNMVWNIMDSAKFYANDVQLPQLSVAPYVEYGVGLQRKWGDRFTGFTQAMLRGGGRNGIALQFGFRWAIGK